MDLASGDTVRHSKLIHLNMGTAFNILNIEGDKALCEFINQKNENEKEWFPVSDLILVNKLEGYSGNDNGGL